jgi:hypothetical protein
VELFVISPGNFSGNSSIQFLLENMADQKTIIRKQIENLIYIIRGHKVMLDEDLAKL